MNLEPKAFLNVAVYGLPIQQGSKQPGKVVNGRSTMYEAKAAILKDWRKHVVSTIQAKHPLGLPPMESGPIFARVLFAFEQPKNLPADRNGWPATTPDLDKLQRGIGDALTMSGIWLDDRKVVRWDTMKAYVGHPDCKLRAQGAWIRLYRVLPTEMG